MSATTARETHSARHECPSLSILLTTADCAEDLERTLLSLSQLPQIDAAELLIGLHGEDGLGTARTLVERYLPLVPTRVESFPLAEAGVARAAMYRYSEAPLVAVLEEGSAIDHQVLARASAALDQDRSLVAARAAAEPGAGGEVVVLRRNDEVAIASDPLVFVREARAGVALVPPAQPGLSETPDEFSELQPSARVRALLVVNVFAAAFYLSWWLRPGHVGVPALFAALALAEAFNLLHLLGLWWSVWRTRAEPPPRCTRDWSIDVFVTTCGEPLDVVRRTVTAALGMEGAHRTYVLDDGGRDDVRALAQSLGAEYIRRGSREGAKAGNLNHALTVTSGELVAVFDADHIPHPEFLTRLVGYFEDSGLAFVQTPQFYGNARHNLVARGAYQQQTIFYGPICRGKNGTNAAFCCGTNVLFRREALTGVGGFDESSVVEDFVTSMHLHRRGWRSVYYPFVVSEGLGPETLGAYFAQQFRWARGSVGALVSLEPFRRGYTLPQRLQYLLASTFYLMGLVTSVYVALPIVYLLAGWSAFSSSSGDFVLYYAPYLVLGLITVRCGLGGRLRLEHLRYTFGAFPVYVAAAVAAFARLPSRFRATGANAGAKVPVYGLVTVGVFFLTQVAILAGLWLRPLDARTFTNVSWAVVNLVLLSGIAFAALRPQRVGTGATGPVSVPVGALPESALARAGTRTLERVRAVDASVLRIAALTTFAFALRLALAGAQSLRLDESLSLKEAQLPLGTMVNNLFRWDVHPPLYYTFLHVWVWLTGTSVLALRVPSVIFGAAAVPLLYAVARRFTSERGATFAAAIGATSPFWIWHSDEARMYTLLLVLSLAALWRLFVAYERNRPRDWVVYGLVLGMSLYSHYFAILMLPVHAVWLLLQRPPRAVVLRRWLPAVVGAASLLLAWLLVMVVHDGVGGVAAINTGVRESPLAFSFLSGFYTFFLFLLVYVLGYGQIGHGAGILGLAAAVLAGGWPLVAVFGVVSGRLGRWLRSREAAVLGFWIAFSLVTVYLLNIWKGNVWMQRYLIAVSPALFVLLGAALARVIRPVMLGTAVIVAVLTVATVVDTFDRGNVATEDWRGVATVLDRSARPGDAVAVVPWFYVTPLDYYFRGPAPVRGALLTGQTPRRALLSTLTRLARTHRGHDLWVATAYESVFDPQGTIRRGLSRSLVPVRQYHLPGQVVLRRYWIPNGPPTGPVLTARLWRDGLRRN
ncbi:MAG TPA: glycosyltransferase [Gaiellaceae bacterium]